MIRMLLIYLLFEQFMLDLTSQDPGARFKARQALAHPWLGDAGRVSEYG